MYGNGNFTRSFMYISDLVEGLIRLMNSNITDPVNLGNPHEFTIHELAITVKNLTGAFNIIRTELALICGNLSNWLYQVCFSKISYLLGIKDSKI